MIIGTELYLLVGLLFTLCCMVVSGKRGRHIAQRDKVLGVVGWIAFLVLLVFDRLARKYWSAY